MFSDKRGIKCFHRGLMYIEHCFNVIVPASSCRLRARTLLCKRLLDLTSISSNIILLRVRTFSIHINKKKSEIMHLTERPLILFVIFLSRFFKSNLIMNTTVWIIYFLIGTFEYPMKIILS